MLGGAAAHERLAQDLLVLPLGLRLLAALQSQQDIQGIGYSGPSNPGRSMLGIVRGQQCFFHG